MKGRMTGRAVLCLACCLLFWMTIGALGEAAPDAGDDFVPNTYEEAAVDPSGELNVPGLTIDGGANGLTIDDGPEASGDASNPLPMAWNENEATDGEAGNRAVEAPEEQLEANLPEVPDETDPAQPDPAADADGAAFGYVIIPDETMVYADEALSVAMGVFRENNKALAQSHGDVLQVWFEAGRVRSQGLTLKSAFVDRGAVELLSESQSEWSREYYQTKNDCYQVNDWPVPPYTSLFEVCATDGEPEYVRLRLGGIAHTPEEIQAYTDAHPAYISQAVLYDEVPTDQRPYYYGKLSDITLRSVLSMVNRFRYIAGLNADVALDMDGMASVQAKAYLNYLNGGMNHHPGKPEVLTDEEYQALITLADSGWWAECLNGGPNLNESIVSYVSDSNNVVPNNIGHRTAVLSPRCVKMAFGSAGVASLHNTEYAGDAVYNVAWPARETPTGYFGGSDLWSIFSCEDEHSVESTAVRLVRRSDGATWNFTADQSDGYYAVSGTQILFRPKDLMLYDAGDTFDVTITDSANMEQLCYTVHFFDLNVDKSEPLPAVETQCLNEPDGVRLTWSAVPGATGYYVCRLEGGFTWEAVTVSGQTYVSISNPNSAFIRIVTDVNELSYLDADVRIGDWYHYLVVAHNDALTSPSYECINQPVYDEQADQYVWIVAFNTPHLQRRLPPAVASVTQAREVDGRGVARVFTVKTPDGADQLEMYDKAGNVVDSWSAGPDSGDSEDGVNWTVRHAFAEAGMHEVTFRARGEDTVFGAGADCAFEVIAPQRVSLDRSAMELTIGDTATLTASLEPAEADTPYTWSTSDDSVAAVGEDGAIEALGKGTATVTVATANGLTAECRVVVTRPEGEATVWLYKGLFSDDQAVYRVNGDGTAEYLMPLASEPTVKVPDRIEVSGQRVKVTAIADRAFWKDTRLTKITIGKYVRKLGKSCFEKCVKLKSVKGGSGIVSIGASAFKGCRRLKSITLGKKVQKIGKYAFYGCKALKKVTIRTTRLKSVGKRAFKGIHAKAAFTLPKKKAKAYRKLIKKAGGRL